MNQGILPTSSPKSKMESQISLTKVHTGLQSELKNINDGEPFRSPLNINDGEPNIQSIIS